MAKASNMMALATDSEADVKSDTEWQTEVKGMLRAEMTRRGVTYEQLSTKLSEIGVMVDPHVLRNKVARGGFSAVFLVQCMRALGCDTLRLS